MTRTIGTRLVYGALAGAMGAACMTVVRSAARRRGVIEKTVPQAAEEWLASRAAARGGPPAVHHVADTVMHLGYGATLGACFGALVGGHSASLVNRGAGFGIGTWIFGSWILLPLLGVQGAPWRKAAAENAVDVLAHLTYGVASALINDELHAQPDRGPSSGTSLRRTRVG
jgi:putative membrane protein